MCFCCNIFDYGHSLGMRAKSRQQGGSYGNTVIGIFLVLSQSWMLYNPSPNDTIMPSIKAVFSNTPRMIFASLTVYAISQLFDVWLYHKWWKFTEKKFGDKRRFLWLRNNGSTLISQILNTALFTAFAFWELMISERLLQSSFQAM